MKTFRLFSMAALALAMAACSNNDDNEIAAPATTAEAGTVHFTATLPAPGSSATTRTTITEGTGDDADKLLVAWKAGDQIALCHNSKKDVVTLTDADINDDGSATISDDISADDGEEVTVVYPAASVTSVSGKTPSFSGRDFTAQAGTLDYIAANLDRRFGDGEIAVSGDKATFDSQITMGEPDISIWKLSLTDGTNALNATQLTIKNGDETIAATTTIGATSVVYLAVPEVSGASLSIEATTASGNYSYSKTGVTLTAGKYYQSTLTLVSYDNEVTAGTFEVPAGEHWLITGSAGEACITIGDGATVTLSGVTMTNEAEGIPCITCSGDATIILADGTTNTLTATELGNCGGIQAGPSGKTLTIKGNTGVLNVEINHGSDAAAIGAYSSACGNIVIEGGVITAKSKNGAAIGACYEKSCGDITITGGTVTATVNGGDAHSGTGIGGHYDTACGNITISGGTVTATGCNSGVGIGGGDYASCGNITITSGVTSVTATKGESASNSIGAGEEGSCGTVTIEDESKVTQN